MVNRRSMPPAMAWNFVSFGLMVFLCGSAWSVAHAKAYQIELAEYKLQVGTALHEVKKVSNSSTIAPVEKQRIQKLTEKSDRTIEAIEKGIGMETDKLINLELEE